MSGEFGDYTGNGFFHDHIRHAGEAKLQADYDLSKQWCEFVEALYPVCKAVSYCEAGDSDISSLILKSLEEIPKIKLSLQKIENGLEIYRRLAEDAIRRHEEQNHES
jgi:hypothetical protein